MVLDAEAKQVRNSKVKPVKARVNPARSRKRINNAKAEAKQAAEAAAAMQQATKCDGGTSLAHRVPTRRPRPGRSLDVPTPV